MGGLRHTELLVCVPDLYFLCEHTSPGKSRWHGPTLPLNCPCFSCFSISRKWEGIQRETERPRGIRGQVVSLKLLWCLDLCYVMGGVGKLSASVAQEGLTVWHTEVRMLHQVFAKRWSFIKYPTDRDQKLTPLVGLPDQPVAGELLGIGEERGCCCRGDKKGTHVPLGSKLHSVPKVLSLGCHWPDILASSIHSWKADSEGRLFPER